MLPQGPYNSKDHEEKIYQLWEQSGFFAPNNDKDKKSYTIILPPPNVTGTLHLGHALMLSIEDILIRYHRMQGFRTLWLPGTDHAAIATQSKVEKIIYKEEGKSRYDLGREEFLKRVEKFAQDSHDTIVKQTKRMGASLDWSREAYTLDEARNRAVNTAFKKMYEDGLIYKGYRIVNWDPKMQTTVSDDEVEYIEEKTPFYYLQYGPFVIATARPETKFGDKYVVMHPDDERYAEYKDGDKIKLEWINGLVEATVIKDEVIDKEFGTGVMTITPWHDMVDFDLAERHNLDKEQIIDFNGRLMPIAGEFSGVKIKEAREKIVEKLKAKGLLVKVEENYAHRIATNSRGGGVIEPQIKEQWFVDVNKKFAVQNSKLKNIKSGQMVSLKELMRAVVESGEIKIMPEHFEKIYFHWIDNLRDWCISRQIWYGHQVPVWYDQQNKIYLQKNKNIFFVRHGESEFNVKKIFAGQMDPDLTSQGIKQAKEVAKELEGIKDVKLFSSDLLRAKKTADIIAEQNGIKNIFLYREFREVFAGEEEGGPADRPILIAALESKKGETLEQLIVRAKKAWNLINSSEEENIVIVGHNSFFAVMKAVAEGVNDKQGLMDYRLKWHMPNAGVFKFSILEDPKGENLHRDPDTLDTWFSSGLWTFSTLGWPDNTEDLKTFHPTDVLETGYDILFFWVARMILMTTYLLGEIPFKNVYLHGLIRDAERQKMSKSKGNAVDPLQVVEEQGADALRMAMVFGTGQGTDVVMSPDKILAQKKFANKIWNASKFVLNNLGENFMLVDWDSRFRENDNIKEEDKNILEALDKTIKNVTKNLDDFMFHEAAQEIYQFFWHDFCDVYIEAVKARLTGENEQEKEQVRQILYYVLLNSLKLLHPFMPFITEVIYLELPNKNKENLIIEEWPK